MNIDTTQGTIEESDTTTDENTTDSEVDDGYQYDADEPDLAKMAHFNPLMLKFELYS